MGAGQGKASGDEKPKVIPGVRVRSDVVLTMEFFSVSL